MANTNQASNAIKSATARSPSRKRGAASTRRASGSRKLTGRRASARSRASSTRLNNAEITLMEQGRAGVRDAYGRLVDAGANLRNVQMPKMPSQRTLQQMGESPLLMGVVGLGLGVLLGAVIPAVGHIRHR
jgi:hypothetical protein